MFIISNFAYLPLWLVCQQFTKSNILHSFFFGKDFKVVCYYAVQRQKNAKLVLFCQTYFLGRSLALWYQLGWTNTNNRRSCPLDTDCLMCGGTVIILEQIFIWMFAVLYTVMFCQSL